MFKKITLISYKKTEKDFAAARLAAILVSCWTGSKLFFNEGLNDLYLECDNVVTLTVVNFHGENQILRVCLVTYRLLIPSPGSNDKDAF